ncbi:hypothetical protein ACFXJ8_37445 [Nonomuraea sp. NPDC059194]|uniref:hypothetical protein n=1 Tax=Nonomuraea sp. NPDC059194 TaxID=3346764 RepID=UPI0036CE64B0
MIALERIMAEHAEPGSLSRAEAVAAVQRIMDVDYADEREAELLLEALARSLVCPSGHLSDLIFWPKVPAPTAQQVVDEALAYRPIAL